MSSEASPGSAAPEKSAPVSQESQRRPAAAVLPAALVETHISVVFFVGDRAYKLKKPVEFPFVDLRTREARERLCHREVELNRRFAPDVYLGVMDLTGPDGELCDHLVVMRRMPDDRRLSLLVSSGAPDVPKIIDQLAVQLARFHEGADRSDAIDQAGTRSAIEELWAENFDEIRRFAGSVVDADDFREAEARAKVFLAGRAPLFDDRIAGRAIGDGHGDLQSDDVFCLEDGPRILDCIEFCDAFRFGDVANDVAFLMMDLERLGAPELGRRFLAVYENTHAPGVAIPPALLDLYIAYRAQVRVKVACLRHAQEIVGSPEAESTRRLADQLMNICLAHLRRATVKLVIVGGLPGTGKSTVARGLADRFGFRVVRSDVVRKHLAGLRAEQPAGATFGEGLYTPAATDEVYKAMMAEAAPLLERGVSVVLDASFTTDQHRQLARDLGRSSHSEVYELRCVLAADDAARRIRARASAGVDASDATPEVAAAMAALADPWVESAELRTDRQAAEVTQAAADLCAIPQISSDLPPDGDFP